MAVNKGLSAPDYSQFKPWYNKPWQEETITEYGIPEYQQALTDYQSKYSGKGGYSDIYGTYSDLFNTAKSAVGEQSAYYQPKGGYGKGLRQEAKETVQGGVGKDLASMVASGMSSSAGAKGVKTLAETELGKMYKNIEDTRNQLWMQAITPYTQMMTSLSQMASISSEWAKARPSYKEYVTPVTTTKSGYGWY